jgi:hypothetical protein
MTDIEEEVARVAKALGEARGIPWRNRSERARRHLMRDARAALEALQEAGWLSREDYEADAANDAARLGGLKRGMRELREKFAAAGVSRDLIWPEWLAAVDALLRSKGWSPPASPGAMLHKLAEAEPMSIEEVGKLTR